MGNLPDINVDGSEVVVTLCYMSHYAPNESEHDTIEEAKSSAEYLVDWNIGAPVAIVMDGDLKLYHRYDGLMYEWVIPDGEEAAFVKKYWPQFFRVKEVSDGRSSPS